MYKSRLQELCQRRSWGLPEYNITREGPDHMPRFAATVNVHGQVFDTPPICRSSKDAHNTVARIAFEHFATSPPPGVQSIPPPASVAEAISPAASLPLEHSISPRPEIVQVSQEPPPLPESPLPSALPLPPAGLLTPKNDSNSKPGEILHGEDIRGASSVYKMAIDSHDMSYKETLHMYKNRLQHYAQKQNMGFPVYTREFEGPPHARRFRSRVSLNGRSYGTEEYFPTLKEAEQAAAKVACQVLSVGGIQEDAGLYKNLLQEFAQKKGLLCPSYETTSSGMSHVPVFMSTVEIGSYTFRGGEARTKKQAEMNAAKVAYYTLTESSPATESSGLSSSGVAENLTFDVPIMPAPNKHHREDKEAQIDAKQAKTSAENVNTCLLGLSNPLSNHSTLLPSQMGNPSFTEPVVGLSVVYPPSDKIRTIVMPRSSELPRPEDADELKYSDDQWVAYRIEPTEERAA